MIGQELILLTRVQAEIDEVVCPSIVVRASPATDINTLSLFVSRRGACIFYHSF